MKGWAKGRPARRSRALVAVLVGWLGLAGFGGWPVAAEVLTIATYNVANYNVENRMTSEGFRLKYPKPEAEKTALRRVIRDLDADVLALQEVGDEAFVRELQRDLRSEGCDYPHVALLVAGDEPRHLMALSRRPFTAEQHHVDLEFSYRGGRERVRRGLLEVRLQTTAGELTLFVAHLKSRYTEHRDDPRAEIRRGAEATVVRNRILRVFPDPAGALFVIAGDLNDGPRDRPVRALTRRGSLVISALVPVRDSRGDHWTHYYRRDDSYTRVDHLLVSPPLVSSVAHGSGRIYDGPGVREASDHRPVVLTLSLPP